MTRRWRRRIVLVALVVAVVVIVVRVTRRPIEVEVSAAVRGPMIVTIDEDGRTRVRSRFVVSAPTTGRLERGLLHPGDRVDARAVVASIRPAVATPLDARSAAQLDAALDAARDGLRRAEAAAAAARAAAQYARAEAARAKLLVTAGAISPAQLDLALMRQEEADEGVVAAEAAVEVAAHEVEAAEAALQPPATGSEGRAAVVVRAPAAGVVLRVFEEHERMVAAGTPLIEIGDPRALEAVIDLLSSDAVRIRPAGRVLFDRWGGEGALEGRVRLVEPSTFTKISALGVEEQRVNVIVDFVDPSSAAALGDGFALDARLVVAEASDVLKIPAGALFRIADGWAVYVVEDGRARLRPVRIGIRAGFQVEALEGLVEGERVIVYPGDRVTADARVTARFPPDRQHSGR
jgi:HlyD family secretion protein